MPDEPLPKLSEAQVVATVRQVICRSDFYEHRRCREYFKALGYDLQSVVELLADCTTDELDWHGPDDQYPERSYYIALFKIELEGEPLPLYVKVALLLPELESGYLLSFHPST